jgi:uroporphyrin-III C-methyltransferase
MPATGRTGRATVSVHGDRDPQTAAALRDVALAAVEAALREDQGLQSRRRPRVSDAGKVGGKGPSEGSGRVTLVGGGPGDPGLLTLRGSQALADADVVVVDRLAPLAVLDGLREGVEIVDVSKIPRGRFTPQEEINDLLVSRARDGLVVVRLKGGDSFVFGRGMEEVIACAEAGVAVEVVPGVSSAIAVPELAGIPLTHRGVSQGFTVVTGHAAPDDPRSTLDWDALARTGTTLVILMGVETLVPVVAALVKAGRDLSTPLACVMDGGLPSQKVLRGTLASVVGSGPPAELRPPAVIVIGAVAAFATG